MAPTRVWVAAVMGAHGLVPTRSQDGRLRRRQGREHFFRILTQLEMEAAPVAIIVGTASESLAALEDGGSGTRRTAASATQCSAS